MSHTLGRNAGMGVPFLASRLKSQFFKVDLHRF